MDTCNIKKTQSNCFSFLVLKLLILFLLLNIAVGCSEISKPDSALLGHWKRKDGQFELYIDREVSWRVDSDGSKMKIPYRIENMNKDEFTFIMINTIDGEEFALKVEFSDDRKTMYNTLVTKVNDKFVSGENNPQV